MRSEHSNRFVTLFSIYYYFYFGLSIAFQHVLLFLILTKSPKVLSNLKLFLINTAILQIIHASSAFFSQQRVLQNSNSTAILHNGPCRAFGPNACFISHHLFLATAMGSALAVASTVIFRYRTLQMGTFNRRRVILFIFLCYIPAIIMMVIPFTVPWDFAAVRAATYAEHPTYDLSIYEPFTGFSDRHTFRYISNTGMLVIAAYSIPCVIGIITKKIINLINQSTMMSSSYKDQSKSLTYGLALQNILPCISYIPPATSWVLSQFGNVEMVYNEHLLTIFIGLPPLMDPLLSFYFIVPFRQAIYSFAGCRKNTLPAVDVSDDSEKVEAQRRNHLVNNS